MITKILFTIFVIVGTTIFFRNKRGKQMQHSTGEPRPRSEKEKMLRQGAYLFMLFMVLSALAVFYFEIGEKYSKVKVHVVNIQTGNRVTYQAEQKDVKTDSFKTLEGRIVYVADIERVEVEPND